MARIRKSALKGLDGTAANDSLLGTDDNDLLQGFAGRDALDGALGADTMLGGAGNDTYTVDATGDLVQELAAEGTDLVIASLDYALPAFVENLTLAGTAGLFGSGNALNNRITGNAGANFLFGDTGNDTLDGGAGADSMLGGLGNDSYVVDDAGDLVMELAGEGTDFVLASVSFALPSNVERLQLTGTLSVNGFGNAAANVMTGNSGNNFLSGGSGPDSLAGGDGADTLRGDAGLDQLTGGAGADIFVLGAASESLPRARDIIRDFTIGEDLLYLSELAPGTSLTYLGTEAFRTGGNTVQLRLAPTGADAVLQIDVPNLAGVTDGLADAEILLIGTQALPRWSIIDAVAPASPRTIHIDPTATRPGDGSAEFPFTGWSGFALEAGNTYLIRAGTQLNDTIVVQGMGTAAQPITIGSYGSGAAPVIRGSISIEQSAHVTLTGLTIADTAFAGITVQHGSHAISIIGNTIQRTGIGVWFASDSGGGNLVQDNLILDSAYHGIAFDRLDHRDAPTLAVHNTIRGSGSHGIEIHANGIVVEDNEVSDNGAVISGSSGIHVYGGVDGGDGYGFDNTILGNLVFNNREAAAGVDGNGIQLDQFTGGNRVEQNSIHGNDGAGILLYDSVANSVTGNTVSGNALSRSGSHPYRGEIILASNVDAVDHLTRDNVIVDNLVTTQDAAVRAFYVDAATADNANSFGANTVTRAAGGEVYSWGGPYGMAGSDLAYWNTVLAPGGGDDIWAM